MTYRRLGKEDEANILLVSEEFIKRGLPLPPLDNILIIVALEEDVMKGFIIVQPQLHCEPLVLYDPLAYRGIMRAMEEEVKKNIQQGILWVTAKDRVAKMAEAVGFVAVPETLYRKVL